MKHALIVEQEDEMFVDGNQINTKRVRNIESSENTSAVTTTLTHEERLTKMADAYKTILECLGENVDREGLLRTPMRAAKAMCFLCNGYGDDVANVVGEGIFNEDTQSDMVLVKDIEIHSLCEHHMVPFSGKAHIAYIPNGKILGLSKLARIANLFSRRLQVQERLTREIAEAIQEITGSKGVAVQIQATHMCMVMRGVEKSGASTVTRTLIGEFEKDKDLRKEFFGHVNSNSQV